MVIHLLAMFPQQLSAAHFVVVVIQIDTGIHAAFHHLQAGRFPFIPIAGENKDTICYKTAVSGNFPGEWRCRCCKNGFAGIPRFPASGAAPAALSHSCGRRPDKSCRSRDPRQSGRSMYSREKVPVDGDFRYRSMDRIADSTASCWALSWRICWWICSFFWESSSSIREMSSFCSTWVIWAGAHAQLFHVGDHLQPGVLIDVIITVAGLGSIYRGLSSSFSS